MSTTLPREIARVCPIFKVWADDGKHPSVALNRPVCVIGRREVGVNLPLQAPEVSKLHALVVRTQRQVYVRDLASRNGVQHNGEPVQEAPLADDDVLRIGAYTLRCASGFGRHEHDREANGIDRDIDVTADAGAGPAELIGPDDERYRFPVGQHTVLIGQRSGCDVRLADDAVAPVHAIVFEMDGKQFVRDLEAPGGTLLNDRPIHQAELNPGDRIRVGQVTLRYELAEPSDEDDAGDGLDALRAGDSAPGIPLIDSVTVESPTAMPTPQASTLASPAPPASAPAADPHDSVIPLDAGDSVTAAEISIEDSRITPRPAPERPASAISEYDFDVIDVDPHPESTFAGEVVAPAATDPADALGEPDGEPGEPDQQESISEHPAQRPEVPPVVATTVQPDLGDSSIPIAGSFHDRIIDDLAEEPRSKGPVAEPLHRVVPEEQPPQGGDAPDDAVAELVEQVALRAEEAAKQADQAAELAEKSAEAAENLQQRWAASRGEGTGGAQPAKRRRGGKRALGRGSPQRE